MWTLEEIREEYDRLDRYLGIDTRPIRLSFSKKMRRQHGVCCFRGDRPTEIRLADFLRADDDAMLDTARHEYAHAAAALLTGRRHGHDAVWKDICVKIGCKPERLAGTTAAQEAKNAGRGYLVSICGTDDMETLRHIARELEIRESGTPYAPNDSVIESFGILEPGRG